MKLLASDFDGTLKFNGQVLADDLEAINKWRDEGNLFVIVTGRSEESIRGQIEKHNVPADYLVTNNGGMVFDMDGEMLYSSQLDTITAIDLMYASHEIPFVASYVVNDGRHRHKVVVHPNVMETRYPNLEPDWTEEEIMDSGNFAQIVLSVESPDNAVKLAESINDYFGSTVTAFANGFVVDIVPYGVDKGTGLQFITAWTGVDEDDVYAIGDGHNDIPMLEACPNGAAIAFAPEDVRAAAREEVPSVGALIESIE